MRQAQEFDFTFKNVEKQYESYSGINVKLRLVLRSLSQGGDVVILTNQVLSTSDISAADRRGLEGEGVVGTLVSDATGLQH